MSRDSYSVMIVGVGGQGTLLTSRILGGVFSGAGYDVKVSEVHGMSQRGGSVVTYVRCGKVVYSPMIEEGEADFILAFEELEAARYLPYLRPDGTMIVNLLRITPATVGEGGAAYPEKIIQKIQQAGAKVIALDATALAKTAGNVKAFNVAILGKLARLMDFSYEEWLAALTDSVPPTFIEVNRKAFDLAYNE